jgi:hypothetical protein
VKVVKLALAVKRESYLCINREARHLIKTLISLKHKREKGAQVLEIGGDTSKGISFFCLGIVVG